MPSEEKESNRWAEIEQLINRHQSPLIRYATSILHEAERAKDVVQDVFAKLCRQSKAEKPHSIEAWLFRAVRNRAFDVIKKEGRMSLFDTPELADNLTRENAQSERRTNEAIQGLFELVDELPAKKKEVVILKFQQGLSYQEISDITGLSASNVGYLLHHAIRELKEQWNAIETASR